MKNLLFPCHAVRTVLLSTFVLFLAFGCKKVNNAIPAPNMPEAANSKFKTNNTITSLHPFKVMSFNLRHGVAGDPQTIEQRIPLIINIISDNTPDIVGFQEYENIDSDTTIKHTIAVQLLNLGYHRSYNFPFSDQGSTKAIYFRTARFSVVSSARFELNSHGRSGVWAILTDSQTSKQYFIVNSHWENLSQATRIINSHSVDSLITAKNTSHLPVICFGDFNAQPGTTEVENLKSAQDLTDALGDSDGDLTFHGWDATGDTKIDWIMSNRDMAYLSPQVITTSYSGHWPSDHWAVMATYVPAVFKDPVEDAGGYSTSTNTRYSFADINGDGKQDKIYWNTGVESGSPKVFLSNGDGSYASAVIHTAGASTSADTHYYYADVNGDGKADEIVWNYNVSSGHTRVFLATSAGSFSATAIENTEGGSGSTATIYNFADVNGDGKADKIYWNSTFDSGHTRVFLATSAGSFNSTAVSGSEGASTTSGTRFYYADVNGDGKYDKILWHPTLNSGKTMVYLSDGDGTFTASSTFSTAAPSTVDSTKFYFADIDGDGRADKVYWRYSAFQGSVKVYFSQTNSTFDGPVYSLRGTATTAATEYYFADITGDGKADQVRWNYQEYSGKLRSYAAN